MIENIFSGLLFMIPFLGVLISLVIAQLSDELFSDIFFIVIFYLYVSEAFFIGLYVLFSVRVV
jgi:hypothetical protein